MPTTWTKEKATEVLQRTGWTEERRLGTEPAGFSRDDRAVRRVRETLAEAGDPLLTARAAVERLMGVVTPGALVAWQLHWLIAHLPPNHITQEALVAKGCWAEAEADPDEDEDQEVEVLTGEGSPSPFRERPSEEAGVRAEAQGGFRADVRDPGSWHRFAPGEVKAQWRRLLREAGVGGGAQEREVAFLALLADRMADLLKETRTPAALSCAEAVAARLTTHQLAVQKGWGRAAAFSDAMLGPLLLSEGTGAEGDREDVPAFMRSAMQAAASVPAASSRSAAGRWAAGGGTRSYGGRGAELGGLRCFRCGEPGHFMQRCPSRR
ncbi:hypothetical protein DIPPA_32388 [Diplonema papillatum]|nr:hypothetical protein DIPPA_29870 [Diplonema papillatum]KAJ9449573.1 hypothetical protein DIPPA_08320 [Diplonema papillatum]KAJ9465900.1 hypothetical protein DIPPA_32388 [Diplonema papillatum]